MPTAVMTESSENTMSSSRIWARITAKLRGPARARCSSALASTLLWISCGLGDQEQPADEQDEIAPEKPRPSTVNRGG